jgi:hypothetical protein
MILLGYMISLIATLLEIAAGVLMLRRRVHRLLPLLSLFFLVSAITDLIAYLVLMLASFEAYSHYYFVYTFSGAVAELLVCWEVLEVLLREVGLDRWLRTRLVVIARAYIVLMFVTVVLSCLEYERALESMTAFIHIDAIFAVIESVAFVSLCVLCSVLRVKRNELVRHASLLFAVSSVSTLFVHIVHQAIRAIGKGEALQVPLDQFRSLVSCILLCWFIKQLSSSGSSDLPHQTWFRFGAATRTPSQG